MTDISPVRLGARTYSAAQPHPCFGPERLEARAIDRDQGDRGFHQGAQPPCCNPDAFGAAFEPVALAPHYMAAPETTPASTEKLLPRGSHPYTVQGPWRTRGARAASMPCCRSCIFAASRRGISRMRPEAPLVRAMGRTGCDPGKDTPNLSPGVISRLPGEWQQDCDRWQRRDVSARRYVYIWADGVYLQARMEPQAELYPGDSRGHA